MSKKLSVMVLIIICLIFQSIPAKAGALGYEDTRIRLGKVVEIIDGEVIRVFFFHGYFAPPSVETVKLIGIDTDASVEAFDYTSNRLLGKTVYFSPEENSNFKPSDMMHANVFYDFEKTVSEELLELGYAKVDDMYKGSEHYHSFLASEYNAKLYEEGRWATNLSQTTDRININTATSFQMKEVLEIENELAAKIVSYRLNNPFNAITEIMAVDVYFDAEWFGENNHLVSVITNINKASYLEMTSLIGNSSNAQTILDELDAYTRFNDIDTFDELENVVHFSNYLPVIEEYLTFESTNTFGGHAKYAVNVNTCNLESFQFATGLGVTEYKKLNDIRNDYFISTVGELYSGNTVFYSSLRYLYNDRVNAYTDINNAGEFELMSLFDQTEMDSAEKKSLAEDIMEGRPYLLMSQVRSHLGSFNYQMIAPYVYVYPEDIPDTYNTNTVPDELHDLMDSSYGGRESRFTNINQISYNGMMELHPDMYYKVVEDIIEYRSRHDFWYQDDLKAIFRDHNQLATYNKIYRYLVFE